MTREWLIACNAKYERLTSGTWRIAVAKLKLGVGRIEHADRGNATACPIVHHRIAVRRAVLHGYVCEALRIAATQVKRGGAWPENADGVGFVR